MNSSALSEVEVRAAQEVARCITRECWPCVASFGEFASPLLGGKYDGCVFVEILGVAEDAYGEIKGHAEEIARRSAWSRGVAVVLRLWTRAETERSFLADFERLAQTQAEEQVILLRNQTEPLGLLEILLCTEAALARRSANWGDAQAVPGYNTEFAVQYDTSTCASFVKAA